MAKAQPKQENIENNEDVKMDSVQSDGPVPGKETKFAFRKKRAVTLPLLKMGEEKPVYLKIIGAMFEAKPIKKLTPGQEAKKPPTLAHVVDLESGEEGQIIVNEVLKSTLIDEYPEDGYVGKSFEFIRHAIKENKNYATFSVTEIEPE